MGRRTKTYQPHLDQRVIAMENAARQQVIDREAQRLAFIKESAARDEIYAKERAASAEATRNAIKQEAERAALASAELQKKIAAVKLSQLTIGSVHSCINGGAMPTEIYPRDVNGDQDFSRESEGAYVLLRIDDNGNASYIGTHGRFGLKAFLSRVSFDQYRILEKQRLEQRSHNMLKVASVKVVRVAESKKAVTVEVLEWL